MPDADPEDGPPVPRSRTATPPPLVTAASLVLVESLLLAGLGVLEVVSLDADRLGLGLSTSVFFLAAAAGLA